MTTKRFSRPAKSALFVVIALILLGWPTAQSAQPAVSAQTPTPDTYWPTAGWRTSTPEEQGVDSKYLTEMLDNIKQQNLDLHSLLIIRHGYIVSETYWKPSGQDDKHELYSCTKSFISTLMGIAVDQGLLNDLERPVVDIFPEDTFANLDAQKKAMTVDNLLTMASGLGWEEGDPAIFAMYRSSDWVKYVLDLPMKTAPGTQFNYCTGCSHVLSAIIQKATGMKSSDFAAKNLFKPLGMSDISWETDRSGVSFGGWGIRMTARDMAKLGYLYLHQGNWDGQQIVSAKWVETATRKHISTPDNLDYGYQWWISPNLGAYTALGRYGQTIMVIPRLDLVVVTTAALENHDPIFELVKRYIVPAVK